MQNFFKSFLSHAAIVSIGLFSSLAVQAENPNRKPSPRLILINMLANGMKSHIFQCTFNVIVPVTRLQITP